MEKSGRLRRLWYRGGSTLSPIARGVGHAPSMNSVDHSGRYFATRFLRALSILALFAAVAMSNGARSADDAARLGAVIDEYTQAVKRVDPYYAPYFNVEDDLDKFGDYLSADYLTRSKKVAADAVEKLRMVDPSALSAKDRRVYALFKGDVGMALRQFDFPSELLDFNQMDNRLREYIDASSHDLTDFPFDSVKHYDAFLKRSEGFPAFVDLQIETLKRGVKEGVVLNCVTARKAINTYKDALEPKIERNPFWRPMQFMPSDFPGEDRTRLESGFRKMIASHILPGFRKFDSYYRNEYLPHCRSGYGLGSLPKGKAWYAYQIEVGTSLRLDAKELHDLGLREVARIGTAIDNIQKRLGFKGTRAAFLMSLKNNPKYFFKNPKDMFDAFEDVRTRIGPIIAKYFSLMPKGDYKIVESGNPEDAAAQYVGPTETQPIGRFAINTHNLRAVAHYDVTTLSLHEAIPGHHFQLALQFEMKDELSEYQRKVFSSNAFVEGWALYSEYLGNEMGAFTDPVQSLGNLEADMLRAVRLVVDSGIHALGWSRARAIRYMKANLADDANSIATEADRYSVTPGQALGYKVGQLKIIELRKKAELELGPTFDIREFHGAVIGRGTVSLQVLEDQVIEWIQSQLMTRK